MNLNGKVAIVTGAANGIGKEIVKLYCENGAQVIGIDCVEAKEKIETVDYVKLDITNSDMCQEVMEQIWEKYEKIDILVNCAGITRDSMTVKMTEQQFDDVVNVNLKGVWNLTKCVGPRMQKNKGGSIINISSVVGTYGNIGQCNYAATKAGVVGMSLSWAKEFALKEGNVRVNVIAPGYTLTDMVKTVPENMLKDFASRTMLGRLAEPIEIANVALFLASDLSSYITGTTIHVNGGMRL